MRPLVAPSEPAALKALGTVSSLPEKVGCDVLAWVAGKKCGVQRKEVGDLLKSVGDGRLAKELAQMQAANVAARLLVVEGRVRWTGDGVMVGQWGAEWTRAQWAGLLWSVQEMGAWVSFTDDVAGTVEEVQWFFAWCAREHRSLHTRPGPGSMWGARATGEEWAQWALQGMPGVGPKLAARVMQAFGRVPLRWDVGRDELLAVEGMGPKKVDALWRLFNGSRDEGDGLQAPGEEAGVVVLPGGGRVWCAYLPPDSAFEVPRVQGGSSGTR